MKPITAAASVLALLTLSLGCVGSRGHVHAGQPQVHTRERLITERQLRAEWLREELEKSEKIKPTRQGLRDIREFSGTYASLRGSFDPAGGKVNAQEFENEQLRLEADRWRLKQQVAEARSAYEDGIISAAPGLNDPAELRDQRSIPKATSPFGVDTELISAEDTLSSKAEDHPLDAFRDRLAYRNAVEGELRTTMFDDAHDASGSELYGLSLDLAVVPGEWSREFIEVEIEFLHAKQCDVRAGELRQLYYKWLSALPALIENDATTLQAQFFQYVGTDSAESAGSQQFQNDLALDLIRIEAARAREATLRQRYFTHSAHSSIADVKNATARLFVATGNPQAFWLYGNDVKTSGRWSPDANTNELWKSVGGKRVHLNQDGTEKSEWTPLSPAGIRSQIDALKLSPKRVDLSPIFRRIVTARYQEHLSSLACVWIDPQGSVRVDEPAAASLKTTWGSTETGSTSYVLRRRGTEPEGFDECYDPEIQPTGTTVRLFGPHEFARRLLIAERDIHAYAAHPRELAQNISDVAARESLMSLVLAVEAMLPAKGVSAALESQKLERLQERFHAILRQPLVVGFSRGASSLGWVLGPRFSLEGGQATFRHTPSSYDVGAAITVPAWIPEILLSGTSKWIHPRGSESNQKRLWNSDVIAVQLPRPTDVMQRITRSLVERDLTGVRTIAGIQRRPKPKVFAPRKGSEETDILSGKGRTLLVLGEEIWRDPQVFLGNQKADRVEIVSSMKGVLAHFDDLEYPKASKPDPTKDDGVSVDLTVVTTFGQDTASEAVTIFHSPEKKDATKPKAADDAKLKSTFLVDSGTLDLRFAFERPKEFHHVTLELTEASQSVAQKIEGRATDWDAEGKVLTLKVPTTKWPNGAKTQVAQLSLEQFGRSNQKDGTVVSGKEKLKVALFKDESARSFLPAAGTAPTSGANSGVHVVAFDGTGKLVTPPSLRFEIQASMRPVFEVAYPGFFAALDKGDVKLKLIGSGAGTAVDTTLEVSKLISPKGQIAIGVKESVLQAARLPLVALGGTYAMTATFPVEGKPVPAEVPIAVTSKVKITQATPTISASLLSNELTIPFHAKAGDRVDTIPASTGLILVQLNADVATLNRFYSGWDKPSGATIMLPGQSLPLEYRSSSGAEHYFGVKVPSNEAALIALGVKTPSLKIGGKPVVMTAASGALTLELKRQLATGLEMTPATIDRPKLAQNVQLVLTVPKGKIAALPVPIVGQKLDLQIADGLQRKLLSEPVALNPVTGDLTVTYQLQSTDADLMLVLGNPEDSGKTVSVLAACNGVPIAVNPKLLQVSQ